MIWGIGDNVNLGNLQSGSAPWRGWPRQASAMGLAVMVGVFGLVGVHRTEGRADAVSSGSRRLCQGDTPCPPGSSGSRRLCQGDTPCPPGSSGSRRLCQGDTPCPPGEAGQADVVADL